MRRRLLHLLTALSLLLCMAIVALWVRSYWSTDTWVWFRLELDAGRATEFRARSENGSLRFSELTLTVATGFYSNPADMKRLIDMEGVSHSSQRKDYGGRQVSRFPHWFLLPPLAVLPVLWARRARTDRRRNARGLCPSCGYDLRATPGRCPECGTAATGSTSG